MVNVANVSVKVDGSVMVAWEASFTRNYKEYTLVAFKQKDEWGYSLGEIGSSGPLATMVVGNVRSQRTAIIGLLLNAGMDYPTASDYAGELYGKIKSTLESINPLY